MFDLVRMDYINQRGSKAIKVNTMCFFNENVCFIVTQTILLHVFNYIN